jgi:hypothetical protein
MKKNDETGVGFRHISDVLDSVTAKIPPKRLKRLKNDIINRYCNGEMTKEDVEFLFDSYPLRSL